MGSREVLQKVIARLTVFRRVNFALALVFPFLLVLALGMALSGGVFPKTFAILLLAAATVVLIWFLEEALPFWPRIAAEDAAKVVDKATGAKERFLTLAADSGNERDAASLRAVESQADTYAGKFDVDRDVRFSLERSARISAILTPFPLGVILFVAIFHSEPEIPLREKALASERAAELRDLVEESKDIPPNVQEELLKLAELLEDSGLSSEEALRQLEQAEEELNEIEELPPDARVVDNEIVDETEKNEPAPKPTPSATPPDASKQAPKNQQQPEKEQQQNKQEQQQEQKSAAKEQKDEQQSSQEKQQQQQQQQEEQDKEKSTGKGSGENGKQGSGQEQNDKGQGKEGEKAGEKDDKNSGKEAQESQQDGKNENKDEKKDETGVGEGQGQGKSGDQKEQHGEKQSGKDDTSAKEGDAENKSAGQSGAGSDESKEKESGKQDQQGGEGEKKGAKEKQQEGKEGKQGSQQGGGKGSDQNRGKGAEAVKQKLEQIREEMAKSDDGSDKNQGDKEAKQPEKSKSGQGTKSEEQKKDPGKEKGTSGKEDGEKDKSSEQSAAGDNKGSEQPETGKEKQDGKSEEQQSGKKEEQRPEEQGGNNTKAPSSKGQPVAKNQNGEAFEPQAKDPNSKSPRPDSLPQPGDNAQRFGPFAGGDEGLLKGKELGTQTVVIPQEEKITVRTLGGSDGKRYKTTGEAKSKLEIGSTEFEKPKSDTADSSQPIPVEYQDILR